MYLVLLPFSLNSSTSSAEDRFHSGDQQKKGGKSGSDIQHKLFDVEGNEG
jgi:hypothetical protein